MSKRQIISSLATVFTLALVTARVAVWVFPLQSSAQEAQWDQSLGVTIDTQGHKLLHGARVEYPASARQKHIEGTVTLQVNVDAKGEVTDARVESGPDELRNAALSSALQWHFTNESGQAASIPVSLSFKIPSGAAGVSKPRIPEISSATTLRRISMFNLPDSLSETVKSRLPLQVGDSLTTASLQRAGEALKQIDEHLGVNLIANPDGSSDVIVILLNSRPAATALARPDFNPPPTDGVKRVRVGGNVQASKLIFQPRPAYPPLAKQARIQGTVRYNVLIGKEGDIRAMELVSGHPLLISMATPAVQQWRYEPTLLNGEPAEVVTVVDVNFTLSQ